MHYLVLLYPNPFWLLFQVQKVDPYVVHATFQYGGTKGKRHRMREALLWADRPPYYADPFFLTIDLDVPSVPPDFEEWEDERMVQFHLAGMDAQLAQVYSL